MDDLDGSVNKGDIETCLAKDPRFVIVKGSLPEDDLILPEHTLFLWYARLNLRHARVQVEKPIITHDHFLILINSLRLDGYWAKIPSEILEFGEQYGFIARTASRKTFFLPISNVLGTVPANIHSRLTNYAAEQLLISLADCTQEQRRKIINTTPETCLYEAIKKLKIRNSRTIVIVLRKEGLLSGTKETLGSIAQDYEITRERVRQITRIFWERLHNSPDFQKILLQGAILFVMKSRGSVLADENSRFIHFLTRACEIPMCLVPYTNFHILGGTPTTLSQLNGVFEGCEVGLTETELASRISRAISLPQKDIRLLAKCILADQSANFKKKDRVLLALKSIGKPAHYSDVFEEFCRLFPEIPITEHSVHAILDRLADSDSVVWIGIKGTYALREWGYERPLQGLFDSITEIVRTQYKKTSNPVSVDKIYTEIGKHRQVINRASVDMAITLNEHITKVSKNHYIPAPEITEVQKSLQDMDTKIHEGISNFRREKTS
ncbi:MAG: hypothetical protein QME90_17560 [Thermodesulfobacteriota bacterium]|nr:hypothetical protein [Thermodesulfobacteriota bacterium]